MRACWRVASLGFFAGCGGSLTAPPPELSEPIPVEPLAASVEPAPRAMSADSSAEREPAKEKGESLPPCPEDMVFVAGKFCIDRYEATMIDKATRRPFSPYYPPSRREVRRAIAGQKWGPAAL